MFFFELLLVTSSLHIAAAIDHYVIPDGEHSSDANAHELNYYLRSKDNYFTSNRQLYFKPGNYYLENNLILTNIHNISIIGDDALITCRPSVGLILINITNITLHNISFTNCAEYYRNYFTLNCSYQIEHKIFTNKVCSHQASILVYNCSLTVKNLSITCDVGVHALMMLNMMTSIDLCNITVLMKIKKLSNNLVISSGIFFRFYTNSTANKVSVSLKKLRFYISQDTYNRYEDFSFIAITMLLMESNISINISIVDMVFANFHNSMAMFYYAKFCKTCGQDLTLDKIKAYNNNANMPVTLFYFVFLGYGLDFKSIQQCNQKHFVSFVNSTFANNVNITTIILVELKHTLLTSTNVTIYKCQVVNNINTSFLLTHSEISSLLQLTHTIKINHLNIINNTNKLPGKNLLSFARSHVKFEGPVIVKENKYYESVITLHFAALQVHGDISIFQNMAYMLANTLENSYFVFEEGVTVEVINNTFHSAIRKADWVDHLGFIGFYDNSKVCAAQFYSPRGNLDDEFAQNRSNFNYKLILINNKVTEPFYLVTNDFGMKSNCSWLANQAFSSKTSSVQVSQAFISYNESQTVFSTKADVYTIPSKICFCISNISRSILDISYNCTKREVGPVFPGQLLKLSLIVPSLSSSTVKKKHYYVMLTARTQNIPKNISNKVCIIENSSEINQIHTSHGCNEYYYTIKYNAFNECELYLRTQQHDTEIVYVELKPCPAGFALDKGMCICDPVLKSEPVSLLSCHLDDETILRPANSWITAETNADNNIHTYHVSLHCPFHYCLPYSSNLNLSNPDSQCQFNRVGFICGECPKGLSVVFGSSNCKRCTNYYLLIIIPFFVISFLLLILIFMFNLTITNGTISIFIFYIDIVGINVSIYFPHCHSILCIFAPSNEIETCFYDGLDNYAKMWLILSYPLYMILIALSLIIASRYSVMFQRLTAKRALPVLATLFLLSFIGLLRTVSFVLFIFTRVAHLPGKHTSFVWAIDTSVALFGPKFILLYIACLIFFVILLAFNVLLLFTKELLQFKMINTIKPLLDVYLGPYKYGFSYWTGLQLLMRIAIFGLTAVDRNMNLMINTILIAVLLCMQTVAQPYKSKFQNFQQSLVLLDIIIINVVALYGGDDENSQALTAVSVLIYTGSYYFITYIICHCIMCTFGKTITKGKTILITRFTIWKQSVMKKKTTGRIHMDSLRRRIADVTYNYQEFQEPLIEID